MKYPLALIAFLSISHAHGMAKLIKLHNNTDKELTGLFVKTGQRSNSKDKIQSPAGTICTIACIMDGQRSPQLDPRPPLQYDAPPQESSIPEALILTLSAANCAPLKKYISPTATRLVVSEQNGKLLLTHAIPSLKYLAGSAIKRAQISVTSDQIPEDLLLEINDENFERTF